jgi:flagellar biosynthesis chaperone FliJ
MSNDNGSKDASRPSVATLNFVIQSLQEHEQNLDMLIAKLTELRQRIDEKTELYISFEKVEKGLSNLEKEIKRLNSLLQVNKE